MNMKDLARDLPETDLETLSVNYGITFDIPNNPEHRMLVDGEVVDRFGGPTARVEIFLTDSQKAVTFRIHTDDGPVSFTVGAYREVEYGYRD